MSQTGEHLSLASAHGSPTLLTESGSELSRWLLEEKMLSKNQLEDAIQRQKETGAPLGMTLLELELIGEVALVDVVARHHNLPTAPDRLYRQQVSLKALSSIPQDLCWQYGVFPFGVDRESARLKVAVVDPGDTEAMENLQALTAGAFDLYVAGPKALEKAIRKHYLDAWVEDSHRQHKKGLRFFGYEGITNPGTEASPRMPESTTPAGPARPPVPTRQRGEREPERERSEDQRREPSGPMHAVARVAIHTSSHAQAAPEPQAALPTPPEQSAVSANPVEEMDKRVRRLEQAVQLLLRLVTEHGGEQLRKDAARVSKLIDG